MPCNEQELDSPELLIVSTKLDWNDTEERCLRFNRCQVTLIQPRIYLHNWRSQTGEMNGRARRQQELLRRRWLKSLGIQPHGDRLSIAVNGDKPVSAVASIHNSSAWHYAAISKTSRIARSTERTLRGATRKNCCWRCSTSCPRQASSRL